MKHTSSKHITLIVLLLSFILTSCAGYGKISRIPRNETNVMLDDILSQTDQYRVHYHGNSEKIVSGILFDPQNDDKHIQPEGHLWNEISDADAIESIVKAIRVGNFPGYYPALYMITNTEGDFYGYLYTGWNSLAIKQMDEQALRVYGLRGPPEYEDFQSGGF